MARKIVEGYKMLHAGGDRSSAGIILHVEISKEVVGIKIWQGRIIAVLMMSHQQMGCVIYVYGPHTGRAEEEKEAFREDVDGMAALGDDQTMMYVAGDVNANIGVVEPGDEASNGRFGEEQGTGKGENWWRC